MNFDTQQETGYSNGSTLSTPEDNMERNDDSDRVSDTIWHTAGILYRWRRFIAAVTVVGAILSIIVALLVPKWYAAEARVLPPEGSGVGLGGLLSSFVPGAAGLFGGSPEFTRSLAILDTRNMMERMVEAFELVEAYGLEDSETPIYDAIDELRTHLEYEVTLDYSYLAIWAYDQEPERAAEMANFLVAELNKEHIRLTSESARRTRISIERRVNEAETDLDSVRADLQAFQEEHGVVELESQARSFMESMASMKADMTRLEIQYQTLAQQYGPENPQVRAAREARNAARREIDRTLGGRDVLLPVALQELPALGRRYAELIQEQLIQAQILEAIYPIYEQTLFQEQSEALAVQIIDEAVPPVLAAKPSRRLIVIGTTLTALLLACAFVLAQTWLRRNAAPLAERLRQAAQTA